MPNLRGHVVVNTLYHGMLVITALLSFFAGMVLKSVKAIMYVHIVGVCLTILVVAPDWKFWHLPTIRDKHTITII